MTPAIAPATVRNGAWQADPGFGVYVHIPFCAHRCHYCDFNTYEGLEDLYGPYVDAVVSEVGRSAGHPVATSVFFGGGTPTLLPASDLGRILDAVRGAVGIAADAELTVEANPETVHEAYFEALLDAGFNRVSIGVQSLRPNVLDGLGRRHAPEVALRAIGAARSAGIEDLNLDLIYGSPWESARDWLGTLEQIVSLEPDHISAYALTVEESTPLATLVNTGRVPDVDPDVQADRHEVAEEVLAAAGYQRYEISNWSKPGRASRHNVLYWSGGDYLGIGAGAHGHLAGYRYWGERLPRDFIVGAAAGKTEAGHEIVQDRGGEALILGLRLTSGIDTAAFERRYPGALSRRATDIDRLISQGMLERHGGWLRLTERATMLANDVSAQLL